MVTYVVLAKFTDQGARSIKETVRRADAVREMAGRFGVRMREFVWTQGQYDIMTLSEGDDEASMVAFGLAVAAAGNARLETMRAFNRDEMSAILAKLP